MDAIFNLMRIDLMRGRNQWSLEENKVVTRFVWTGTHQSDFLGIPARGRPVKVWGSVIEQFGENKIKNTRIIMDVADLMAQLSNSP